MEAIKTLDELVERVKSLPRKKIAVAFGQDPYTIESLAQSVNEGLANAILIGDKSVIESVCSIPISQPRTFDILIASSLESFPRFSLTLVSSPGSYFSSGLPAI